MAVGFPVKADYVTGDVLTANNMNDLSGTLNTIQSVEYAAGKNKIINGDFYINQRAFTSSTAGGYGLDRWSSVVADGTVTYSVQTFTVGAAPVTGYEGKNFARLVTTGQTLSTAQGRLFQGIEDVRTFANQTVTISFWAKAATGTPKMAIELNQDFGTGGSPSTAVANYAGQVTLTTSWVRYSLTLAIPSISGKTIGTTTPGGLFLQMWGSAGSSFNSRTGSLGIQSNTFDIWGVQVEASSTASDFQTATGTLQGELAACQRYFYQVPDGLNEIIGLGFNYSTTEADMVLQLPVTMRTTPTLVTTSGTDYFKFFRNTSTDSFDGFTIAGESTTSAVWLYNNTQISGTAGHAGLFQFNNALAKLAFSAEL